MPHSRPRRRTSGTAAAPGHRSPAGIVRSLLVGVVAGTVVLTGAAPAGAAGHRPVRLRSADLVPRGVAEAAAAAGQEETGRRPGGRRAGRA